MSKKIAIPSAQPGGLEAGLGMHFGHCDLYTIVDVDDNNAVTAVNLKDASLMLKAVA